MDPSRRTSRRWNALDRCFTLALPMSPPKAVNRTVTMSPAAPDGTAAQQWTVNRLFTIPRTGSNNIGAAGHPFTREQRQQHDAIQQRRD